MDDLADYEPWLGMRLSENTFNAVPDSFLPRFVELEGESAAEVCSLWRKTKPRWPDAVIGGRCSLSQSVLSAAIQYAQIGVPGIHLFANKVGGDDDSRYLVESLYKVHQALLKLALRD